ncbi:MAG: asparagine synthase-related protein, partial [Candidatus Promineifilaceae bacterium]
MSAFCGLFQRNAKPLSPNPLMAAMDELAPYGKDSYAVWRANCVALGHQTTYLTPQSVGRTLPVAHPSRSLVVTGKFRLDNRAKLCRLLGLDDVVAIIPDSDLLLHAYAKWGTAMVERLLGDFAFALWDGEQRQLFCARDHIGTIPFYYHTTHDTFFCASDTAGLLAFDGVPRQLNLPYVKAILSHALSYHPEQTFYQNVWRLPPATALTVAAGGMHKRVYWEPPLGESISYRNDNEYADHLRELMIRATNDRLRTSYTSASHISGGLDSTAITVLAGRHHHQTAGQPQHLAYAYAPTPDTEYTPVEMKQHYTLFDDRKVVTDVCEAERVPIVYSNLTPEGQAAHLLRDITTKDRMFGLPREWMISKDAAGRGVRSMLSGWGGDEFATFNGRNYFTGLFNRREYTKWLWERWQHYRVWEHATFWGPARPILGRLLLGDRLFERLKPNAQKHPLQHRHEPPPEPTAEALRQRGLNAEFVEALGQVDALQRPEQVPIEDASSKMLMLYQRHHIAFRMESWAVNARDGVTYSYPFTDRWIVEFCFRAPKYLFHKQGWQRWLSREATAGILPDLVRWNQHKLDVSVMGTAQGKESRVDVLCRDYLQTHQTRIEAGGYLDVDVLLKMERLPTRLLWLATLP